MDAYIYCADLWCGRCITEQLIADGEAGPAAIDMDPAEVLAQVIAANGFTSADDYDSGDLPKGPYPNGGGEADRPQHCASCYVLLENPLTEDGESYVREWAAEAGKGKAAATRQWRDFYAYLFDQDSEAKGYNVVEGRNGGVVAWLKSERDAERLAREYNIWGGNTYRVEEA